MFDGKREIGRKHKDPACVPHQVSVYYLLSGSVAVSQTKLCRIEEGAELPRDQGRTTRIPWGKRKFQGRRGLQPVALQKKLQGGPAGSPHGASPALNAFHLSAWVPLQVHPANIRAGNFLFAAIADGGISLVPYPPFRRVGICNLACGVEWHRVSLSRF